MIKKLHINGQEIPVPVPVKSLYEALAWVEQTLMQSGQVITRISLNGQNQDDVSEKTLKRTLLEQSHALEIQIDSPKELLVQSLEAIFNLTRFILGSIKMVAIACWRDTSATGPTNLASFESDLRLVMDLLDQVNNILTVGEADAIAIKGQLVLLNTHYNAILELRKQASWMQVARVLLNRIEPTLKDISIEVESLHVRTLTEISQAARTG